MTRSVWANEHPDSYDVLLESVLLQLGFKDWSWHNDVSASFGMEGVHFYDGVVGTLRVWIAPERIADREMPEMSRFQIDRVKTDNGDEILPSQHCDGPLTMLYVLSEGLRQSAELQAEAHQKVASMARMKAEEEARLGPLIEEYGRFAASIMLCHSIKLSSADEHLFDPALPDYARAYLREFVRRWEVAQQGDA